MRVFLLSAVTVALAASGAAQQAPVNRSIDPTHMFLTEPVKGSIAEVVEPVKGSNIPLRLVYVEMIDGVYSPVGLRVPPGKGPFPLVVFAHMNGGLGAQWIREWTQNGSWTLEEFLKAGYAVAWMRYRAEIRNGYATRLVEGVQEGRQIFNRGPLDHEDAIALIKYLKTRPEIDPDRVGYVGLSHGGEMLLKIATEYHGLRAGIASEPAAYEYVARRARQAGQGRVDQPETLPSASEADQKKATDELRAQIDEAVAKDRVRAIDTPIWVQGRDRDHNQAVFRLSYELLREAGKPVEWKSYEHPEHGFIFVKRDRTGAYDPDAVQRQVVRESIAYFDRMMRPKGP